MSGAGATGPEGKTGGHTAAKLARDYSKQLPRSAGQLVEEAAGSQFRDHIFKGR